MAAPITHHFAHPDHELKLRDYHVPHTCDFCGEALAGSGYSCHRRLCGFNLHEECASYPETLSAFFVHPWHDLTLARAAAAAADGGGGGCPRRICHVCREDAVPAADGAFLYSCAPCGFDMHPRCSRLPRVVHSELHPEHALAAVSGMGTCAACGEPCYVWLYRCAPCGVDLHIGCLHGAAPSKGVGGAGGTGSSTSQIVGAIAQAGANVLADVLESKING